MVSLRHHKDGVRALTFASDGACLASASDDGDVALWSVTPSEIFKGSIQQVLNPHEVSDVSRIATQFSFPELWH